MTREEEANNGFVHWLQEKDDNLECQHRFEEKTASSEWHQLRYLLRIAGYSAGYARFRETQQHSLKAVKNEKADQVYHSRK